MRAGTAARKRAGRLGACVTPVDDQKAAPEDAATLPGKSRRGEKRPTDGVLERYHDSEEPVRVVLLYCVTGFCVLYQELSVAA